MYGKENRLRKSTSAGQRERERDSERIERMKDIAKKREKEKKEIEFLRKQQPLNWFMS